MAKLKANRAQKSKQLFKPPKSSSARKSSGNKNSNAKIKTAQSTKMTPRKNPFELAAIIDDPLLGH